MVSIKLTGKRVSGSPRQALQDHWGYKAAKELFGEKNIIRPEHFYLVWWDAVGAAMSSYPKMYRVWGVVQAWVGQWITFLTLP